MSNRYRVRLVTNSQPITDTPVPTWTPNGFRLTDHPTPSIRSSYSHYDAYRTREPTHPALQQTGSYRIDHAIQLDSTVHNTTFVSAEACVLPHQLDPLGLFGPYGTGGGQSGTKHSPPPFKSARDCRKSCCRKPQPSCVTRNGEAVLHQALLGINPERPVGFQEMGSPRVGGVWPGETGWNLAGGGGC